MSSITESLEILLDRCQTLQTEVAQQVKEVSCTEMDDLEGVRRINAILTPLEIDIKTIELQLKRLKINLKESEQYMVFKTVKAKDEQVVLDTFDINEALLGLKLVRNKLRDHRDYLLYSIELKIKERD